MTKVPSLQRRHFELIAETIRDARISTEARKEIADAFVRELAFSNPNFKPERFREACGT